jgi:hypothetical protein
MVRFTVKRLEAWSEVKRLQSFKRTRRARPMAHEIGAKRKFDAKNILFFSHGSQTP